jgi:LuxR family maltose regulon positive regulatory protein
MGRGDWYAPADRDRVPAMAPHHLRRPAVFDALDAGATGRLLRVCAGPGFGKTSELASWARQRSAAWYTVDVRDGDAAGFAAGLVVAVRRRVGGAASAVQPLIWSRRLGPEGGSDLTVEAVAAALAEWLEQSLERDLALVIDDCDRLPAGSPGAGLLGALGRQAPARLHLVLSGRSLPALRGLAGGHTAEVNASLLAFTRAETAAALAAVLGAEAVGLADAAHELTGGWPAMVRILAEALDQVPSEHRATRLATLKRPGEGLVEFVIEEVVAGSEAGVAELLRMTSALPGFTASICRAGGLATEEATLHRLARHGLLTRHAGAGEPMFEVPQLIAEAVQVCLPPPEAGRDRALRRAAVDWLVEHGHPAAALSTVRGLDDDGALVDHLTRWGDSLLAGGEVAAVAHAVDAVPEILRTPHLWRLAGQSRQVRGDWRGALDFLHRATGDAPRLPAGLAWRLGLIYYFRGELDEALRVFRRGVSPDAHAGEGGPDDAAADRARLMSWIAATHWLRQNHVECREAAVRALDLGHRVR